MQPYASVGSGQDYLSWSILSRPGYMNEKAASSQNEQLLCLYEKLRSKMVVKWGRDPATDTGGSLMCEFRREVVLRAK